MLPSQITPLAEAAAYHLNDTKTSQRRALALAMTLVDQLPFAASDMHIMRIRRDFSFPWGVRLDVHSDAADLFDEVAAELNATRESKVSGIGGSSVICYELLVGDVAGVPFEIRAYMGTQKVQVAA